MKRKIVLLISLLLTAIMSFTMTACLTTDDSGSDASNSYLYSFTLLDETGAPVLGEATFSAEGREDVTSIITNGVTKKITLYFDTTYTITVSGYETGTVTIDADGYESANTITLVKIIPKVELNVTATNQLGDQLTPVVTPSVSANNYVIGETYTVTVEGYEGQEFTFVAQEGANVTFTFTKYVSPSVTATNQLDEEVNDIVIKDASGTVISNGVYVAGTTYYVTSATYADQTLTFVAGDSDVSLEFTKYVTLNVTATNQLNDAVSDIVIKDASGAVISNGVYVVGATYTVTADGYADQTLTFVAGDSDVSLEFTKYVTITVEAVNKNDVAQTPIVKDSASNVVEAVSGNQYKLVAGETYYVTVYGDETAQSFEANQDGTVNLTFENATITLNVTAKDQTNATLTPVVSPSVTDNKYEVGGTYTVTVDGYEGQEFTFVAQEGVNVDFTFVKYVTITVVAKDQTNATLTPVVSPSVTDNKYEVGGTYTVTVDGYDGQSFTFVAQEGVNVDFTFVKYVTITVVAKDQTGATLTPVITPSVTDNKYVVNTEYTVTVEGYAESFTFTATADGTQTFDDFVKYVALTVTATNQFSEDVTIVVKDADGVQVNDGKYVVGATYTVTADGYDNQDKTFTAEDGEPTVAVTGFIKYVTASVTLPESTFYTISASDTVTTNGTLTITITPVVTATITAVKIDDETLTLTDNVATWTKPETSSATSHTVTVEFTNTESIVTLTLATDGYTNPIDDGDYIAEGSTVTLTNASSETVTATVGANGLITARLAYGSWTVAVKDTNYRTATFEFTDVPTVTLTKTLVYEMFDETTTDTYITNGYKFTTSGSKVFSTTDIMYVEMTVKMPDVTTVTTEKGIQRIGAVVNSASTAHYSVIKYADSDSASGESQLALRWASSSPSNWTTTTSTTQFGTDFLSAYKEGTLKIAMLITNNFGWVLMGTGTTMYYDDCWTGQTFNYIKQIGADVASEYSNVRFAKGKDALATLGYDIFSTEFQGFESTDGWTVTENSDNTYDLTSSYSNSNTLYASDLVTDTYSGNNGGFNGYLITNKTEISFTIEMTFSTSQSGTGWWAHMHLKGAWTNINVQFCVWGTNVNAKNASTEGMSAANMLNNGATKVDNGDGTYTWTFDAVVKADENGYVALYNSAGTLIYSTANVGTAYKMETFNNIYFSVGKDSNATSGSVTFKNFKVTL